MPTGLEELRYKGKNPCNFIDILEVQDPFFARVSYYSQQILLSALFKILKLKIKLNLKFKGIFHPT